MCAMCQLLIGQSTGQIGQMANGATNFGQILVNIVKMVKQEGHNWKLDKT